MQIQLSYNNFWKENKKRKKCPKRTNRLNIHVQRKKEPSKKERCKVGRCTMASRQEHDKILAFAKMVHRGRGQKQGPKQDRMNDEIAVTADHRAMSDILIFSECEDGYLQMRFNQLGY